MGKQMIIVPENKDQSYKLPKDDFEGDNVCEDCPKLDYSKNMLLCTVYPSVGMAYRQRVGHCPVVGRWANWRTDKPKPVLTLKQRLGQQKQQKEKKGGR